jgi:glycosyltransferase involved in cell wall biosynthesis
MTINSLKILFKSVISHHRLLLIACFYRSFFRFFKSSPENRTIFIAEKQNWAIKNVCYSIIQCLHSSSSAHVSLNPFLYHNCIIVFPSQYQWVMLYKYLSPSNRYVACFFHGKHSDGAAVSHHIDQFLHSIPLLSAIVVSCTIVRDRLIQLGVPKDKLYLIPIGVNTSLFSLRTHSDYLTSRSLFSIPEQAFVIGSFQKDGLGWGDGSLPKYIKGPDVFVQVLLLLKQRGIPVHAFLTGPARGYVKKRLSEYSIPFTHIYAQDKHDLLPCFHSLDAYLVTSREEGGPMGLIEALSCGVPCVSTSVGMAPDLLRSIVPVCLSPVDDIDSLASSLTNFAVSPVNPILPHTLRNRALTVDWTVVSSYYQQLFDRLAF